VLLGMRIVGGGSVRVKVVARQVWVSGLPLWFGRDLGPRSQDFVREEEQCVKKLQLDKCDRDSGS